MEIYTAPKPRRMGRLPYVAERSLRVPPKRRTFARPYRAEHGWASPSQQLN